MSLQSDSNDDSANYHKFFCKDNQQIDKAKVDTTLSSSSKRNLPVRKQSFFNIKSIEIVDEEDVAKAVKEPIYS